MAIFEEVKLTWDGREFKIPPDRVMQAIAKIEDHITLVELRDYAERGTAPLAKLAAAFGAVLRHAGARVEDDEVYAGMFKAGAMQGEAMRAVETLLLLMIPPEALTKIPAKDAPTGKGGPARPPRSSHRRSN